MRRIVLTLATLALLGASVPSQAASQSRDYIALGGDALSMCEGEPIDEAPGVEAPANIGGACFNWGSGKSFVEIKFADAVNGANIGFYYQWYNGSGEFINGDEVDELGDPIAIWGTACAPKKLPVYPAARGMKIWVDQGFGPLDCPNGVGIGTTGTVTADIT